MPEQEKRQHNTAQWHGPVYPHYSTNNTRMQSCASWPAISKHKAEKLSNAGFFYTDKVRHT